MTPRPPTSTLFPYTTLFRSGLILGDAHQVVVEVVLGVGVDLHHRLLLVGEVGQRAELLERLEGEADRKSTRLNSSHLGISYAVFCLKKKKKHNRAVKQRTQI